MSVHLSELLMSLVSLSEQYYLTLGEISTECFQCLIQKFPNVLIPLILFVSGYCEQINFVNLLTDCLRQLACMGHLSEYTCQNIINIWRCAVEYSSHQATCYSLCSITLHNGGHPYLAFKTLNKYLLKVILQSCTMNGMQSPLISFEWCTIEIRLAITTPSVCHGE